MKKNDGASTSAETNANRRVATRGIQDTARTGNLEAVQEHIEGASNLNEKEPATGDSPQHAAAATFGQLEAVRWDTASASLDLPRRPFRRNENGLLTDGVGRLIRSNSGVAQFRDEL